jgi:hypothetical protein
MQSSRAGFLNLIVSTCCLRNRAVSAETLLLDHHTKERIVPYHIHHVANTSLVQCRQIPYNVPRFWLHISSQGPRQGPRHVRTGRLLHQLMQFVTRQMMQLCAFALQVGTGAPVYAEACETGHMPTAYSCHRRHIVRSNIMAGA